VARLASGLSPVIARIGRLHRLPSWWRGHRRSMRWSMGIAILLLGCATATFGWLDYRSGQVTDARVEARAVAEKVVPTLLSYDPRTIADDLNSRLPQLADPFRRDYESLMRDVIAPAAASAKMGTQSSVTATGVVPTADPDEVKFIMFMSQAAVTEGAQPQQPLGGQVVATLRKVDGSWLVSGLSTP
jgi:Mce-associated membrane protein